jgi:hypothetical protein
MKIRENKIKYLIKIKMPPIMGDHLKEIGKIK